MFSRTVLLSAAFALPAACTNMVTPNEILDATDVEKIAAIANGYGSTMVSTDNFGDPLIEGRIEGIYYAVLFFGCENGGDCQGIEMFARWEDVDGITLKQINTWNHDMRFAKAYIDTDGVPAVEMDVNLLNGVRASNLDISFDYWSILLVSLDSYLRERGS